MEEGTVPINMYVKCMDVRWVHWNRYAHRTIDIVIYLWKPMWYLSVPGCLILGENSSPSYLECALVHAHLGIILHIALYMHIIGVYFPIFMVLCKMLWLIYILHCTHHPTNDHNCDMMKFSVLAPIQITRYYDRNHGHALLSHQLVSRSYNHHYTQHAWMVPNELMK